MVDRSLSIDFYKSAKRMSKCLICENTEIQWHHVCPAEKITEVFKIAKTGNMDLTIHELNKCVPLCQDCHSDVHAGRIHGWLRGKFNDGRMSHANQAVRYMPYLNFIGLVPKREMAA